MATIAIDFDDTITTDPEGWASVINLMSQRGHTFHIVTWRFPSECDEVEAFAVDCNVKSIFATGRQGKRAFMESKGIEVDIWIGDWPEVIVFSQEQLRKMHE